MVSPRIREVADEKEMAQVIDDFMTQGYTIKEQGTQSTLLKKKSWGVWRWLDRVDSRGSDLDHLHIGDQLGYSNSLRDIRALRSA